MVTGLPDVPPPVLQICSVKVTVSGGFCPMFVDGFAVLLKVKCGGSGVGSIGRSKPCLVKISLQSSAAVSESVE